VTRASTDSAIFSGARGCCEVSAVGQPCSILRGAVAVGFRIARKPGQSLVDNVPPNRHTITSTAPKLFRRLSSTAIDTILFIVGGGPDR
jgi:hypothetical protein